MPVFVLADSDVRGRQVHEHRRPREGGIARRRNRHPQVLADLHEKRPGAADTKQQPFAEGNVVLIGQVDTSAPGRSRRGELPHFIVFPVVGQEGLGHHAQNTPLMQDRSAVEQQGVHLQRQADDGDQIGFPRRPQHGAERLLGTVKQRLLVEQVFTRVGRQAELREHCHHGFGSLGLLDQRHRAGGVEDRIRHPHLGDAQGDTNETVLVEVEKFAVRLHRRNLAMTLNSRR